MAKVKKDGTPSKQGEGGGRPPKYNTEQEILDVILAYFKESDNAKKLVNKAGLLLRLDIDRPVYAEYKKKFPNALRVAERTIEDAWVSRLAGNSATGAIFYLKNAYHELYRDRTETDITSGGKQIPIFDYVQRAGKNNGNGQNKKAHEAN